MLLSTKLANERFVHRKDCADVGLAQGLLKPGMPDVEATVHFRDKPSACELSECQSLKHLIHKNSLLRCWRSVF